MPNHKIGSSYSFTQLLDDYQADPQGDDDAHYLLYRGQEILALCLRFHYNPNPTEVCVGDDPVVAQWGETLASLKDKQALPLYHSPRGSRLYKFMGQYMITGHTVDREELAKRQGPVPLSRVVFLQRVEEAAS